MCSSLKAVFFKAIIQIEGKAIEFGFAGPGNIAKNTDFLG
jgi:hypothetical protein